MSSMPDTENETSQNKIDMEKENSTHSRLAVQTACAWIRYYIIEYTKAPLAGLK